MFTLLTSLGLAILPFFIWPGCDTRSPKLFMALVISLILGLYVIYKGYLKPYKNIWFLLFLLYIPLNYLLTPKIKLLIFGLPMPTFWVVQAYLIILIFFLAHIAFNGMQFTDKGKIIILKVMVWTGTIMAIYAIFQRLGFDQYWVTRYDNEISKVGGTLGNRVILAPFLAMIVPLALYLKKYIQAILLIGVIFLCNSQIAYGALIVSLMFLLATKGKKLRITMISLFVALSLILSVGYFKSPQIKSFINDSYRFPIWNTIIQDIKTPREVVKDKKQQFALTGFGLGSFRYIFHTEHKNTTTPGMLLAEAHNDYLELLYNTGLIGLGLFLAGLVFLIKQFFPLDLLNAHLLTSLVCVLICAGGIFVLQNGAIIFYVLTIIGLVNRRGENVCQV